MVGPFDEMSLQLVERARQMPLARQHTRKIRETDERKFDPVQSQNQTCAGDESQLHQLGKKMSPHIFMGYVSRAERGQVR